MEGRSELDVSVRYPDSAFGSTESRPMNIVFRFAAELMTEVRADLARPHPFAYERVGFISIRAAALADGLLLLADSYFPVPDEEYIDDPSVGAMLGQEAIRKALDLALLQGVGVV